MILTAAQLRSYYQTGFIVVADDDYAVPAGKWLALTLYPWFWEMRTRLGLRVYSRRNDCDNYARALAQAAEDCHALTPDGEGTKAEGLAVGEFFYRKASGDMHAICTAIVDDGKRIFFEPQTGNALNLSPEEIASATFVRF